MRDPLVVGMRQNSKWRNEKNGTADRVCDEAWVEKKFGVPAEKVVDLLGLMGDSIDNIPGRRESALRARSNIQEFGSIENALERWEEVKHKTYRESLGITPFDPAVERVGANKT